MTQDTFTPVGARIGSKALIREMNEAIVLDVVRSRGTTSRAEIVGATGLSAATVTGITGQLVGEGLLAETDVLRGTGGRPARLLELGRGAVVAAGVRLTPNHVDVALVDLRGDIVAVDTEELASVIPERVADTVARAVEKVVEGNPIGSMRGVSIAVSGIVDAATGVVRHSGAFGWEGVALADLVAARTGSRVVVDSLVNGFTTGLLLLDSDLAGRDVLVCSVGTSLGASIVVRGGIHRGHNGSAGGFAHSRATVGVQGRPCHCGDRGCLETWSSVWGMAREWERRAGAGVGADLADAAAAAVREEGGSRLGIALADAAKMAGPEVVVVALGADVPPGEFAAGCRSAFTREFEFGEDRAPKLRIIAGESEVFVRGAGYALVSELFSTR